MERAVIFNYQMRELFGEGSRRAEPGLWFLSVAFGIVMSKRVYDNAKASSSKMKIYRSLSKTEQIEWNNRAFSTAHAVLVSAVSGYLLVVSDLFYGSSAYGPVIFRSSIFSQVILGVSIGYFIADLSMILWMYPKLGGFVYVVHHLLSVISLGLALHSGYLHFYLYMVLLSEVTTPFVNLRWYLSTAGLSKSNAYITNGILLFLSWLVFRVVLFLYFFVHVYRHYDQVKLLQREHLLGFCFFFTSPPLLGMLNLFWFYKITQGLRKALQQQKQHKG